MCSLVFFVDKLKLFNNFEELIWVKIKEVVIVIYLK